MDSLHWCFHCPSSTNWVASLSPPPYTPTLLPPPSPTFPSPVPDQSFLPDMSCDSILFAELTDEETNMKVAVSVHVYSDMTAELVFDEMPHCLSKVFAAPQPKKRPGTLEFEHSTIAATLSVESAKIKDTSTELNSDLDNKTAEAGLVTATFDSQPLVIVTGDTKSEFKRHEALSIGFIFPDLENIGVVSSLFDEMPDSRVAYRYSLTSEYVAVPYILLYFPFDPGSTVRLVIDKGATGACVGHTAICLSGVEGKLWVSESGQKPDMESGCKLFETKPEKNNFAAFCGPTRAVTTAHTIFDDTMGRYKYAYSFDLGSTTRYPESRSDILIMDGITLMHQTKCLNLPFDPGVYIVLEVPSISFEMCNDLSIVHHIAYPLRKSRGCIILLEVGSLFTLNRPYWSYSINIPVVVHDMQFYWKVPTQANCDIADAFIPGDFSFVATIEGLLNLVTILVTNNDLKVSSETYFIPYVSDQNTFPCDMRNELFSLFLDVTVSYSCAIIKSVDDDLKVVQLCAHSLFVEKSRIRKAYHIVEIGFGRESLVTEIDKPPGYTTTTLLERDVVDDREISTKKMEPALFCKCWIGLANVLAILKLVLVNFPDSRDSTIFPINYVVSSCTLHDNRYLIAKYAKDSCTQVAAQLIYLGEKYFAAEEILFMVLKWMKEIHCQATKVAGATVGFNVMQVITKPLAAAIAYGLGKNISKGAIKQSARIFNKMGDLGFPATWFACSQLLSLYNQFHKIQFANIFLLVDKENIRSTAFTSLKMIDSKDHSYGISEMAHIIVTIQVDRIQLHIHIPGIMAKHYTFGGLVEKVTPLGVQESLLIAVIKASLTLVILVLRCENSVCISFVEAVLKILLSALHVDSMDGGSLYCVLTHNLVAFSDVIQKYNYVEEATNGLTIDGLSKKYFVLVHDGGFTAWCWHKIITLLAEAGFKVTTMDLTGISIHSFDINSISSLPQYAMPPLLFLECLLMERR